MIRNVTFSLSDSLLKKAREKATRERRSLNVLVRRWLKNYVDEAKPFDYDSFMKKVGYVKVGRKFSRQEMNER